VPRANIVLVTLQQAINSTSATTADLTDHSQDELANRRRLWQSGDFLVRVLLRPSSLDAGQIVTRLREGHTPLQPAHHHRTQAAVVFVRMGAQRAPQVFPVGKRRVRQNPDHRVGGIVVQAHGATDDPRVLVEHALPQADAQQDHFGRTGPLFFGREEPPYNRTDAEHIKELGSHVAQAHMFGPFVAGHVGDQFRGKGDRLKGLVVLTPRTVSRKGGCASGPRSRIDLPQAHHPLLVGDGQRPEEHLIEQTEDRRGPRNPDRQNRHDHERGCRLLRQAAESDPHIVPQAE
jgi:hypothetical protein